MSTTKAMREKIVEAARKRFFHYGYSKTTMAEVAGDCNMSPGNLYRYFPGKLDIAEEIGRESLRKTLERLKQAVRDAGPSATDKLRAYLFMGLETTFRQFTADYKVFEMSLILRRERPDRLEKEMKAEQALLADILEAGNASGEFQVKDPGWAAEVILAATYLFRYPHLHVSASLEKLKAELEGVVQLMLRGITARDDESDAATSGRKAGSGAAQDPRSVPGFL